MEMGRAKLTGVKLWQAFSMFSKMVKVATLTTNFCRISLSGSPEDVLRHVTRPISNSAPKKLAVATKRWGEKFGFDNGLFKKKRCHLFFISLNCCFIQTKFINND